MSKKDIVFCKGGGCTAKLGPGVLSRVLERIPKKYDENLIIGFESSDDASVYKLTDDIAMVQTLDFFPPMVDDPYTFGKIAAANALSDIYAMGGEVKTALNIVCFPEHMDLNILGDIIQGGSEKVEEAGGVLSGGHSIMDQDVKYGLSVTGIINPNKIYANNGCKIGDKLILTKPLGVGIVSTANRVQEASEEAMQKAIDSMCTLNKYAAEIIRNYDVHACTDVTGFSLLGHLNEMLDEKTAIVDSKSVPYIEEARGYAEEFLLTAAGQRNRNFLQDKVSFEIDDFAMEEILFDPQTSGGLLVAVNPDDVEKLMEDLKSLKLPYGVIGEVVEKQAHKIIVK